MQKIRKNKKLILIGVAMSVFLVSISVKVFLMQNPAPPPLSFPEIESAQVAAENNDISFVAQEDSSVYDLMDKLRREGKLDFTERNYIGMGKFVVSINGVKGNGSKNWIYYVNNKKMEIGISNYKVTEGDVVSWKYEDSF